MIKKILKLIFVAIFVNLINCEEFKVIEIENGPIKGVQQESIFEKTQFYSFKGIPYAKPPIGDLRFELSQKLEKWTETMETLEIGSGCLNFIENKNIEKNSEDCLFLNVYTPDLSTSKKLPVMIFINGESIQDNSFYGPDFLMDENVILVTFNYRFGIFGFLSLNSTDLPKNIGLKDQQFVLKWVHENIHKFGGDKKTVTLFGQGTGSSFAHLHSLSHESRQYFEKLILQSGVAIGNWAYGQNGYNHENEIFKFAHNNGEECTNLKECIIFLKNVDSKLLLESTKYKLWSTVPGKKLSVLPYRPVIEGEDIEHPFITDRPEFLMKNKKLNMDMMIGYTTQEFITMNPETTDSSLLKQFFNQFEFSLPRNDFNFAANSEIFQEISSKVKKFYFPNGTNLTTNLILQFNNLFSDMIFAYPADRTAKSNFIKGHGKIYYYRFGVDDFLNTAKISSEIIIGGAGHNDEICYIFKCADMSEIYEKLNSDSTAYKTVQTMSKLWADFAKYGNPTKNSEIEWKSFSRQYPNYFYITNDGATYEMEDSVLASETNRRLQFWDDLFENYAIFAEY